MLNKVETYIKKNNLLGDGLYLVALSGGADSVCLLRVLLSLGYNVEAVHCNFKLRGNESERDEIFCQTLCGSLNVPFHTIHFDTRDYAELHKMSIEMAARELRYSYFERLRVAIGADDIVVAHHRDDNIETFLLNIIRGTGIHGLEGIKARNGYIVRPLLCLTRKEILQYLNSIGQNYITDSSNLVDDVQRNKLRLNIIPLLKTVNPAALDNIQKSMENVSEAVKVYDEAIIKSKNECLKGNVISLPILKQQSSPECTMFELLHSFGIPSGLIRSIYGSLNAPTGKLWQSGEWTIAKDRDSLILDKTPHLLPEMKIPETGVYCYNSNKAKVSISVVERTSDVMPSKDPMMVTLNADKVLFPLTLRPVRVGDTFYPFGMKGKKLVSDYLTDSKANYFEKARQLVIEDASGTILWLIGRRTSQKVSIDENTIKILSIRYSK